jgi:hypothetical protein
MNGPIKQSFSVVRLCVALAVVTLAALIAGPSQPRLEARLDLTVVLSETGKPSPARVYLFKDGKPFRFSPVDALLPLRVDLFYRERLWTRSEHPKTLEITNDGDSHFILLEGRGTYDLPAGQYRVEAYHGIVHAPAAADFTLAPGEDRKLTLALAPVGGARPPAWLSGDDHIHLTRVADDNPIFLSWLQADHLTVGNFLQLQRQVDAAEQYAFGADPRSQRPGAEIRSGHESRSEFYGHVNLLGPSRLIRPLSIGKLYANSPEAYPFPLVLFQQGRTLGATVGYAHFDGSQPHSTLLMDLALGSIDFIEVFQFGVLKKEPWYRLLNAGFRVTGVAGSDFPANLSRLKPWPRSVPLLGPERTLVPGEPGANDYDRWAEGVRRGNAIVTNGPLITLEVQGRGPGAVIDWSGDSVSIEGVAKGVSTRPIENIEVIANGVVIAARNGDGKQTSLDVPIRGRLTTSTWLAARVRSRRENPEPELWGHTNPIYVLRDRRPVWIKADREELARAWENEVTYYRGPALEFAKPEHRQELLDRLDESLRILKSEPVTWP